MKLRVLGGLELNVLSMKEREPELGFSGPTYTLGRCGDPPLIPACIGGDSRLAILPMLVALGLMGRPYLGE